MGLATPAVKSPQDTADERPRRRSPAPLLILASYLLGALYLTGRLWVDPASYAQNGDMHDVDQMSWFMRYSEQAISHFHLPALVTSGMNAPHTVNLMWNTSLLLPGIVMSPITALAGPQVSLDVLLVLGFAGSAASLYFVLRRWGASLTAAAIGGALYGFSPAMIASGIGHYHLLLAMVPPLMIDALLRIVTGRGNAIRTGIWLGLLAAAQLFIGEEALIDTLIAGAVLLIVLVLSRPQGVLRQTRHSLVGLGTSAAVALVLTIRGLWVQFHGVSLASSGAIPVVQHHGRLTHLYTIPYAFVVPSSKMIIHTGASARIALNYPQPSPEYLAYLGIPLIILLLAAGIYFWHNLYIRIPFLTFLLLELLSLGGQRIGPYPGVLLPWYWIQSLPVMRSVLPDRLSILADGAAAAVLAFALDQVRIRWAASTEKGWRNPIVLGMTAVVIAILPLVPVPYSPAQADSVPGGYAGTFRQLGLPANARVLLIPVANGALTQTLRWEADRGFPQQMIGGDFIDASAKGRQSRSGRAGETPLTVYIDNLYLHLPAGPRPSRAAIVAQMAAWKPSAIVADTSVNSTLGKFLITEFGKPTIDDHKWLGWRLAASGMPAGM